MILHHYTGAGNDFLIADGRSQDCMMLQDVKVISRLCAQYGTDGLMVLDSSDTHDFEMLYFNSDGSGGMMCGNGGRCIVAFAKDMGVVGDSCRFMAPDGEHEAQILSDEGAVKTVRLKMIDVHGITVYEDGDFLNTGTRHFVRLVENVDAVDVENVGREVRHRMEFAPQGTNVNFVEPKDNRLFVRTFEKGVEAETLACGTGIVASALASYCNGVEPSSFDQQRVRYDITARRGDALAVDFIPTTDEGFEASSVYLTGPAEKLEEFEISL